MKTIKLFLAFTFLILSCKNKTINDRTSFTVLVTDTAISHSRYNEIDFSRKVSEALNLPIIYSGVDSFELRIWSYGFIQPNVGLIVRYINNQWTIHKYEYYFTNEKVDSGRISYISTPNDIDKIIAAVLQDSIINLPSQEAIPNFVDKVGDGHSYTIEIATRKFYKALQYHCPEHYPSEAKHVRFMLFFNFLDSHFHFNRFRC